MFKLILTSIIFTIVTIYLWSLTSIPLVYSFLILGQGHFLLSYYYMYKKGGVTFASIIKYWILLAPLLLLLQRDIFSFQELAILAGTLFFIHLLFDEFHFRNLSIIKDDIPTLLVCAMPWFTVLINAYFEVSQILLIGTTSLLCLPFAAYKISTYFVTKNQKNQRETLTRNLLFFNFLSVFLLPILFTYDIIDLFACIVLYHIFIWHVRTFIREKFSYNYLILAVGSVTVFLILYLFRSSVPVIHNLFLSLSMYFIWAIVHILATFRYYEPVQNYILQKIGFDVKKEFQLWSYPRFFILSSFCVILFSMVIIVHSKFAQLASNNAPVGGLKDLFFSLLPYYDTSYFHGEIANIIKWSGQLLLLAMPRFFPFMLLTHSILIMTRAFTINLTQLPPPDGMLPINSYNTFGGDLFFSGHVALPFLYALVFWDIKLVRYIFMMVTLLFAVTTLLGRYHYSIDIFAAPFIAYGVFVISKNLFKKMYSQTKTIDIVL